MKKLYRDTIEYTHYEFVLKENFYYFEFHFTVNIKSKGGYKREPCLIRVPANIIMLYEVTASRFKDENGNFYTTDSTEKAFKQFLDDVKKILTPSLGDCLTILEKNHGELEIYPPMIDIALNEACKDILEQYKNNITNDVWYDHKW